MRRARSALIAALGALVSLVLTLVGLGHAQKSVPFPAVTVSLTVDIMDPDAWLPMHQEVLATLPGSPKALVVSVPAPQGAPRSISLNEPKFWMTLNSARGFKVANVFVRGKVAGPDALQGLPAFVRVLAEAGGGPVSGLRLEYGLASVVGDLIEVKIEER